MFDSASTSFAQSYLGQKVPSGGLLFNNHGTNSDADHCIIRLETEIRGLDKLELQPEVPVVLDAIENPEVVQAL